MTSFETITPEEYQKLVDNEKKIFDLTENFTTTEILNKYRNTDENVDKKIKENEKNKEKYENLDKIINKSIGKIKESSIITNNYYSNENDEDDKYMEYINKEMNDNIISEIYEQNYRFNNDGEILDSFSKIFKEYDMEYNPRPNTRYYRVRYLLNKIKGMYL